MIDVHTHFGPSLLAKVANSEITCLVNGAEPKEWRRNSLWTKQHANIYASYGLHPWNAGSFCIEEIEQYNPRVIGETGMDSVWCNVDLKVQQACFVEQLELASRIGASVVLHTKGQEKQVLDIISHYPIRYLVHWYDDLEYLEQYIQLGCSFTVPINLPQNKVAQQIVKQVPACRLLPESDGLEAVCWALGRNVDFEQYIELMEINLGLIAQYKNIKKEELEQVFNTGFKLFAGDKVM